MVGVARVPSFLLDAAREVESSYVYVYPEFFDAKRELMSGRAIINYISRIMQNRDRIVIAVYPDYQLEDKWSLCSLDIIWIYPLHRRDELYRLPRCIDIVGIPSDRESRDYALFEIYDDIKALGYRLWLLGLRPSAVKLLRIYDFVGTDITTLSVPKWQYADNRQPYARDAFKLFVKYLTKGVVLHKYQLLGLLGLQLDTSRPNNSLW